jgi:hypothetical protein
VWLRTLKEIALLDEVEAGTQSMQTTNKEIDGDDEPP